MEEIKNEARAWTSVTDMIRASKVPETSARRYMDRFARFFQRKKIGKTTLYDSAGVELLMKISKLYADGKGRADIEAILEADVKVFDQDVAPANKGTVEAVAVVPHQGDMPLPMALNKLAEAVTALADQRMKIETLETRLAAVEMLHQRVAALEGVAEEEPPQALGPLGKLWKALNRPRGVWV